MEKTLLVLCLLVSIAPAASRRCYSCLGKNDCQQREVDCPRQDDKCRTSAIKVSSVLLAQESISKSCASNAATSIKTFVSPNELFQLFHEETVCDADLCNSQSNFSSEAGGNDLYCLGCVSPGKGCDSEKIKQMQCRGDQRQCVDMKVTGMFAGGRTAVNLKGCGTIPGCSENLAFASETSSLVVGCCDGNFCNNGVEPVNVDQTENGIECYSCNSADGNSCSDDVDKTKCYGPLTSCLEMTGISMKDGTPKPSVVKGCATPAMCDSNVLPLLQLLANATIQCCNGGLCNNKLTEADVKLDGYLPPGSGVPGSGHTNGSGGANSSTGYNNAGNSSDSTGNGASFPPYSSGNSSSGNNGTIYSSGSNSSNYYNGGMSGSNNGSGSPNSTAGYSMPGNGTAFNNNGSNASNNTLLGNNAPGPNGSSAYNTNPGNGSSSDSTWSGSNPNLSSPSGSYNGSANGNVSNTDGSSNNGSISNTGSTLGGSTNNTGGGSTGSNSESNTGNTENNKAGLSSAASFTILVCAMLVNILSRI